MNWKTLAAILVTQLTLLVGSAARSDAQLKKITIEETNNAPFFLYSGDGVFAKRDASYLKTLKKYVEQRGFPTHEDDELSFVLSSLKWVSSQWDHDGMNEPKKGARGLEVLKDVYDKKVQYRCVEYGMVLSDVLQAYGFVTRQISMRSPDVAYGPPGSGHVASEVWMNGFGKWIFLDVQFGLYLTTKDQAIPLSYYEIFEEKRGGHWDELQLHFLKTPKNSNQDAKDYKSFLARYFGYLSVSDGGIESPRISLFMETKQPSVTFQGMPNDNLVFTDNVKLVYPPMNRVTVLLKYRHEPPNFKATLDKLKIENDEDYLMKMGEFAATPEFKAVLKTTEPNFDHYEYREAGGSWNRVKGDNFDWDAKKTTNNLEVRAVNKMGRAGPATYMKISFE